jgi:hypothetical protein
VIDLEYHNGTRFLDHVGSSNLARAVRRPIGGRRRPGRNLYRKLSVRTDPAPLRDAVPDLAAGNSTGLLAATHEANRRTTLERIYCRL